MQLKYPLYIFILLCFTGHLNQSKLHDFYDGPMQAAMLEYEKTKAPDGKVYKNELYDILVKMKNTDMTTAAIPGITWEERGPNNFGGRTRTIYIDRNDNTGKTAWAAGVAGGLFKTTDISVGSPTWTPINDFFDNLAITDIVADTMHPDTMYFCTGEGYYNVDAVAGGGVWKTTNGGSTWSKLAATTGTAFAYSYNMWHVGVDTIFVGTRTGLQRSLNGGTTWTQVYTGSVIDIDMGGGRMHIAKGNIFSAGVYAFSDDFGTTWKNTTADHNFVAMAGACKRFEIAVAPSNTDIIYAVTQHTSNYKSDKILISTDKGVTWRTKNLPTDLDPGIGTDFTRGQAWYDLIMKVDPNDAKRVFLGGVDLFVSADSCNAWSQMTHWYGGFSRQNVHADQHSIEFDPFDSKKVYFGNDGGVYRTTNGNVAIPTIVNRNNSYNVTQFYSADYHPDSGSNHFLAGAQDNGSHRFSTAGINSTVRVTSGDGAFVHIDQDQPAYQYTSYVYNNFRRSTNSGSSFTNVNHSNTGRFINPSDFDDRNNRVYSAYNTNTYLRWDNPHTGNTFASVAVTAFNGRQLSAVTVSPNTNHTVFFGTDQGRVVKVVNAQTTTPTITHINNASGMPASYISCIAIEKGDDDHLLVTYSSYNVNSVYETTNGGTTWTSVEGNLANMPIRWAIFSPFGADSAFLATELGVWSTTDLNGTSTNWGATNTGLANVRVDMIKVRLSDSTLVAATHGRGLYTSSLMVPLPVNWIGSRMKILDKSFELSWETTNEEEVSHFEIWYQKLEPVLSSVSGYGASLNAKGGYNVINKYSKIFTPKLGDGKYQVTLKQYDKRDHLSSTKKFIGTIGIPSNQLSYGIIHNELSLNNVLKHKKYNVSIFNLSGQVVYQKEMGSKTKIPLNFLQNGIYILRINSEGANLITEKVLL